MKKLLILLALLLLPCMALAEDVSLAVPDYIEETLPAQPLWRAETYRETRMRMQKDMKNGQWLDRVPSEKDVDVYHWDGGWAVIGYNGTLGYFPTQRLTNVRRLSDAPIPGFVSVDGVATMLRDVHLESQDYRGGNTLRPGDQLCIRASGLVPIMRSTAMLAPGSFTFTPFVPAEEAVPGDILHGYTTFYNDYLGAGEPENRAANIQEAARRLNGVTIAPGAKFSFNALCGPYKRNNGYLRAKNVAKNAYEYGGGVSQVSTTVFEALMGVDHTLTAWKLHSYEGAKYAPRNLDAAVSSTRDLAFVNDHDFPLVMDVMAQDGVLTVLFRKGSEPSAE